MNTVAYEELASVFVRIVLVFLLVTSRTGSGFWHP
jgi:hypothetical protein